tara:strand:+ start:580 stop:1056 length:477 start_codon:yes stop_codon:yes gene_type:complete
MTNDDEFLAFLRDKESISNMIFQYATALDHRQWDLLVPLFKQDVHYSYGGYVTGTGGDDLIAMIRSNLDGCGPSQHLFSNLRITASSQGDPNKANCLFYGRVMHAGVEEESHLLFDFWGEYRCQLVRDTQIGAHHWLISEIEQTGFHHTGDMKILKGK